VMIDVQWTGEKITRIKLCTSYSQIIKSAQWDWPCNAHERNEKHDDILVGKFQRARLLGRTSHRCEDNGKVDLTEIVWADSRSQWPAPTLESWVRNPLEAWMSVYVYSVFLLFYV
jgi:hypothetical protein